MKVLYQPDIRTWQYKCTCGICTAKLEASYDDLKYRTDKRWYSSEWGGYYSDIDYYYVICPICSKEVIVHPGDIPYLLKEHTKKVSNEGNQKSGYK